MLKLAKKTDNLKTSPTLALVARAKELQSKGHDVVSLTVGEPDWATFAPVAEFGIEAIQKGQTRYTPANGTVELRKALAEILEKELRVPVGVPNMMVGPGAKF